MNTNWKRCTFLGLLLLLLGTLGWAGQLKRGTKLAKFHVAATADGYGLENVSAKLLQHFPNGARVQVTLDDPDHGKTSITGVITKLSGRSFRVKTPEKLAFSASGKTWLLVRGSGGLGDKTTPGEPPCSGCPRDNSLDMDPDESSCWCYASVAGHVSLSPPGTVKPVPSGCGASSGLQ